jgi:phenylacetic acid degradation operon negative regulatory protein
MAHPDAETRTADALQPQDLVLTMLGAHLRRPGQTVWSGGMVRLLDSFGFTTGSARAALSRLVLRNLLVRTRQARFVHYALGGRAERLLAEGDRRIFSFGRTEAAVDVWTVLWHSIPEDQRVERSRLVSRLRFLGFGSVQDATWLAAHDREQDVLTLLREIGIEAHVSLFVGRISQGVAPTALADSAWSLDEVAARYRGFLSAYGPLQRAAARRRLSAEDAFVARTEMLHRFRGFPFIDPELPAAIDPLQTLRGDVVATFDAVYEQLEPVADGYFRSVARRTPGSDSPPDGELPDLLNMSAR